MKKLFDLVTGNWGLVACAFALGLIVGVVPVWKYQAARIDAIQAKYDGFVATVKAEGDAAQKIADNARAEDERNKERTNREYQTTIDTLRDDVKRLRDERTRRNYVPTAPTGSRSPNLACFDRAELEQALRRFDERVTGLIAEGDEARVGLNVSRSWASGIRVDKFPDSQAIPRP